MITVIIVSYNSGDILLQCMHELFSSKRFRIIIIDNNSTDGSVNKLCSTFPEVEVVSLDKNLGYGRATNIGFKMVATPYAFLLNPDLEVTTNQIDQFLLEVQESHRKAAIFAPAVKQADYTKSGLVEKKWVIGAAMLFDMKQLESIGHFDKNFFLFYEEKDLCKRVRDAGKEILMCSNTFFNHLKGQCCSPNPHIEHLKNWHVGWSSMYYLKKHNLLTGKHTPWRIISSYTYKKLFSFNRRKRQKYKSRLAGIHAFRRGEKAFFKNGNPQQLDAIKK